MKDNKDSEMIEVKKLEADALDMVRGGYEVYDISDPKIHPLRYMDILEKICILKRDNPGITREEAISRARIQFFKQYREQLVGIECWMTEEKWETLLD